MNPNRYPPPPPPDEDVNARLIAAGEAHRAAAQALRGAHELHQAATDTALEEAVKPAQELAATATGHARYHAAAADHAHQAQLGE